MPILYHPQASYEFYIAPGSSSVNITAAIFNVGGVTLDVETGGQSLATSEWEPLSTARTEIQALSDGDTIDFGNRKFAAQVGDHDQFGIAINSKSFTMRNGRFSMGKTASWTSIGDGVYAAEHNFSDYGNPSFYLLDDNATDKPLMNINIDSQTSEMSPYRFCYHSGWFPIKDNQLDIDNGSVQYTALPGGDGTTGPIYGWTITNAELKTKVNNLLSGVTMEGTTLGASAGPWVMVHSGPNAVATANIVSWNNSTGVMELSPMGGRTTIIVYRGTYCQFAICGLPDQTLNDGEYLIDMTNGITAGRMLYKPAYGTNPIDARIPVSDYGFRLGGGGCTFEIDGTRFEGNSQRDGQPAIIADVNNTSAFTVKNCKIENFTLGLRLAWSDGVTVDRNIITRSNVRGANVRDSVILTNNIFTHVESYSGVAIQTPSGDSVEPSLVENNIFSLEASTHGQGLSVYADAWRKATTRHNIFYNCQRAFSFQPDAESSRPEETGTMTFENNLMIVDVLLDKPSFITGQTNLAFNGAIDEEVSGATNPQQVIIKNNSHLTTDRLGYGLSPASVVQLSTMDLKKLQFSQVYIENNITGTILAPDTNSDPNFNGGHTHANNVTTLRNLSGGNNSAVATTDKLVHPNRADYLVGDTLNGKVVQGGAFDGGRQGIRWTTVPTLAQVDQIISTENVEWASSFPAQTLPAGGSYSNATDGTVEYGMTGGGTGGMAAWRTQVTGKKASWQITHAGGVVGVGGYQYGASGYVAEKDPPGLEIRCAPAYSVNDSGIYWDFEVAADRDSFVAGISASYVKLSVLVTVGGSGDNVREGGYYAGNTNQVYNYYWDPNDNFFAKSTKMVQLRGLTAAVNGPSANVSDAWPDSGITGHLWGDYPKYTITAQSTSFTLNTLVEGSSGPDVWTAFDYEDVGNTTDNPQTYARYPARFITPIIDEFTSRQEIRVLTHPYGGALTGGTELNGVDKVEFYLNGGPAVLGIKKTDPATGQENIWSVQMPSGLSADMVEVRAKVFPKVGRTNVLQGTGHKTAEEAIALYGDRRDDNPPFPSSPYMEGIYPNRRGCLIENGLTTYYVSPSGNDSNTGLSSGQAKLTPEAVYTAASDGKVKIINEYGKADALHVSRYVRQDASQADTDHIPVVEGGFVIWNNGNTTNNNNSVGCIFKNVDFRPDTSADSLKLNIRCVGSARFVFIGCDFGPDAKADSHGGQFGEIEDQSHVGSLPGLRVELNITAVYMSPTFFYNCDFRHSVCYSTREVVDTVFVLTPALDVCNGQLLYNVQCKDVAAIIYPYGSAGYGLTSFVPKGSARSYTAFGTTAGITHEERDIRDILDPFYSSLGTSAGVSGSPYAGVTVGTETINNKAVWTVIDPGVTMIEKYEEIPNLGFYPDWSFALRKVGQPWDRPNIDLGYFTGVTTDANPVQYAGGTAHRGYVADGNPSVASDPHVDITQTFYESDFGQTAEDGGVWNSMIANLDVTGYMNNYQGIFWSDASRVDESGFWDINLQIDTSKDSATMFTAGGDYLEYQQFVHLGPNVGNDIGEFKTRFLVDTTGASPAPQRNLYFYETDGWVFPSVAEDQAGVAAQVYDWVTAPTSKLNAVGISFDDDGSYNSWLVTDNPYNVWREPVFTGFQFGGTLDGSADGGGIRFVLPGACGDLTGPLGAFGNYAQSTTGLNYTNLGWGSNRYRFGITGESSSGILTDPQSGQTFQSWDTSNPKPTRDELLATSVWLSSLGWRAIAGITYNVGSTYESYFEFTVVDYSEAGTTWAPAFGIQNGYMQLEGSQVRNYIRNQIDSGFPQNYNADGNSTFTYEGVPMQMTYYFEKRYR